jgi:hypothetical protein
MENPYAPFALLRASENHHTSIDTFTMESNGAVKFVRSTSLKSQVPGLTNLSSLTMDHTGQTLYVGADVGNAEINP